MLYRDTNRCRLTEHGPGIATQARVVRTCLEVAESTSVDSSSNSLNVVKNRPFFRGLALHNHLGFIIILHWQLVNKNKAKQTNQTSKQKETT